MAIVEGTSAGFVAASPVADPGGAYWLHFSGNTNAGKFTSPADATAVTEIGYHCPDSSADQGDMSVAIYEDSGGMPGNRIGSGSGTATAGAGWKKVTGLNIAISGSTTYWIAAWVEALTNDQRVDADDSVGDEIEFTNSEIPSPWGGKYGEYDDYIVAIYAVYTTGGGGIDEVKLNVGDVWKDVEEIQINIGDVWKDVVEIQINIGDVWKTVWP